ncbi:hypothetical protein [Flaviflexus huanghaiensis]|uniref:hypothetical protein n=1 Tax=Flaviflexus huanghaiensis TaxID=1111473 RepID=UPI0015FE1AFB|nr:hypothetical protein [Flaviflexus huanghaiensis]
MTASSNEQNVEAPKSVAGDREGSGVAQVTAWAFAFLLLRVFAVSDYDWNTAFLVSTTLGFDDGLALVFGSLMASYVATAILLVCVLPPFIAGSLWGTGKHRQGMILLAILNLLVLIALTTSYNLWWLPAAVAAVLATLFLIHRLPSTNRLRRSVSTALARAGLTAGLAALLIAAFVQTPWVPKEEIETTDGTVTGYVLSVDAGYLNVLTEDHEFVILLSDDVLSRT